MNEDIRKKAEEVMKEDSPRGERLRKYHKK